MIRKRFGPLILAEFAELPLDNITSVDRLARFVVKFGLHITGALLKIFVRIVGIFFAPAPFRNGRCLNREDDQVNDREANNEKKTQKLVGGWVYWFRR